MNVWIVFDDCPSEFGEKEIIKVFGSRRLAEYYEANARIKEPYLTQYFRVKRYKIENEVKIG